MSESVSWVNHPLIKAISDHPLVQEYHKQVTEPLVQSLHHAKIYHPSDLYWIDDHLQMKLDMPGFDQNDVKTTINGNILTVTAKRESIAKAMEKAKKDITKVVLHRPLEYFAVFHLPIEVKDDGEKPKISEKSHKLVNGVLTIDIINVQSAKACKPNQSE